jgi:hypothetical protein
MVRRRGRRGEEKEEKEKEEGKEEEARRVKSVRELAQNFPLLEPFQPSRHLSLPQLHTHNLLTPKPSHSFPHLLPLQQLPHNHLQLDSHARVPLFDKQSGGLHGSMVGRHHLLQVVHDNLVGRGDLATILL